MGWALEEGLFQWGIRMWGDTCPFSQGRGKVDLDDSDSGLRFSVSEEAGLRPLQSQTETPWA